MIKVCNNFMEGIDRADENIDKYRTSIRGKKWHSSPLLSVSHWPYKMHGNFIKHMTRSQWIFWRLIGCHYVETQGHPADLCRTGRPQKRHIDSRYDGLSHVIVKQGKQRRCTRCQKNALLDITPISRYLPSPQIRNIILHIMFNVRSGTQQLNAIFFSLFKFLFLIFFFATHVNFMNKVKMSTFGINGLS